MTREEKLYSMTLVSLVEVANKLGIKIDKKGAKSKAVAKILEAENAQDEVKNPNEIQDDEYVAEVMEQKKELGIECPPIESVEIVSDDCAGDGTPLAEVGKEIAEQAKQKARRTVKKEKNVKVSVDISAKRNEVESVCKKIGYSIKWYEKQPRSIVVLNNDGKAVATMYLSNSKCDLDMRLNDVPKNIKPDRVRNCQFGASINIDYDFMSAKLEEILPQLVYTKNSRKKEEK